MVYFIEKVKIPRITCFSSLFLQKQTYQDCQNGLLVVLLYKNISNLNKSKIVKLVHHFDRLKYDFKQYYVALHRGV